MDFVSCLLCDILNGMLTPGGILIDNDRFYAIHSPPRACCRHVLVLAPKQHVLSAEQLRRSDLRHIAGIQQTLDTALQALAPGRIVRVEPLPAGRFGHLAWLVFSEDDDWRPRTERLAPAAEHMVRAWAGEVELGLDEARIAAAGGRLPPPAPVPGEAERSTLRAPGTRFCPHCGAKLVPEDYVGNRCHGCGATIV